MVCFLKRRGSEMSDCPRFGKWIKGCNFEAVFEYGVPDLSAFQSIRSMPKSVLESFRPKKYIHHVCTTCGKISKGEVK